MVDLQPDNSIGYHNLGAVYLAMARYDEAISILRKGLTLKENLQRLEQFGVGLHVPQSLF